MPLPTVRGPEKRESFLGRCMGDKVMNDEYPDRSQRYAICNSIWRKAKKEEDRRMLGTIVAALRRRKLEVQEGVVSYGNLPFADVKVKWDAAAAKERVRKWAGGDKDKIDWAKYRKAFLWYDVKDPENFGSYKLPIADVIGGVLKVVPKAVMAAGGVMRGARGGVSIPSSDKSKIKNILQKYYHKMDRKAPWEDSIQVSGIVLWEAFPSLRQAINTAVEDALGDSYLVVDFSNKEIIAHNSETDQYYKIPYRFTKTQGVEFTGGVKEVKKVVSYVEQNLSTKDLVDTAKANMDAFEFLLQETKK